MRSKYAMPVDPKILQQDFESYKTVKNISRIVKLMKSLDEHTFTQKVEEAEKINIFVGGLWLHINTGFGINLKDREKLLPIFQEYHRLSKSFSTWYDYLYRGVYLPNAYGDILEETFGNIEEGYVDLQNHKEIEKIFEGLAYGLRSWTDELSLAKFFSRQGKERIIFVLDEDRGNVVLEGNALIQLIQEIKYGVGERRYPFPLDRSEYIVYLKNPKITNVYKEIDGSQTYWFVNVVDNL